MRNRKIAGVAPRPHGSTASILAGVHQPVGLDPRHHAAQFLADPLDRMLAADAAVGSQHRRAGLIFQNEFPGKLIMKGKEAMRKDYEFLTKVPKLYCKIQKRIIQGNMVIDHEEVSGFGPKPLYAVAVYIIEFGKITKVYFKQ